MVLDTHSPTILRFGTFEVDLRAGELRKQGKRIKIQEQPFHVLTVLLQRPGEVVTREELRNQNWPPDTFVDFDNSLNTAINKLREALADSADNPQFIETLPRRGYRFLAPVSSDKARKAHSLAVRWWVGSGVAVILLVATVAVWLFWRSRQARRLTDKDTIVLADFTNTTGDPVFDDALKQGLRVQLEQSPFLNILSDQNVSEELRLMRRSPDQRLTPDVARDLCQRVGSKAILSGSISSLGTHYVIGLTALNCASGDVLGSEQVEADSREHVLKALGESAIQMRKKLGESLATIQRYDAPLEQATTTSLEALKAYTLGLNTVDTRGKGGGIPFFRRAVELDSTFAMAYARLGALTSPSSSSVENVRKAYELRGKVTELERLYIEAHYHRDVTGNLDAAAAIWEMMRQTYPRAVEPHTNLGLHYARLGNYEMALEEAQEAVRLYPNDQGNCAELAWLYMCLNRLPEAEAVFKQAEASNLESEGLLRGRYQLAFLKGDTPEMERLAGTSSDKKLQGWAEAYHGKLRRAQELFRSEKRVCGEHCVNLSLIEAYFGDTQQTRFDADAALKAMKLNVNRGNYFSVLHLALALAVAGDVTRAEKLAIGVEKDQPQSTHVQRWLPTIRAAIALAQKNPEKAVALLRGTSSYELGAGQELFPIYERGQAYLMLHKGDVAASEFQKIVDHPGIVGTNPIGALAHVGLARAYALEGDNAKARDTYEDFLTLWKDADPDIPVLKEAKAEYAKLR